MPSRVRGRVCASGVLVAAICAGVASGKAAAGVIIDDFNATNLVWPFSQTTVGSTVLIDPGVVGVLGGDRRFTVEAQGLAVPGLDAITLAVFPPVGILDYGSSGGADGRLLLEYEGDSGNLDVDLSGQTAIEIVFTLFDFANNVPLEIMVMLDDGTNTASGIASLTVPAAQTLQMSFAGFSGIGALDLSSIDSITIEFDPGRSADFRVDEIRVIPVPPALGLLALAGLATRRRRYG